MRRVPSVYNHKSRRQPFGCRLLFASFNFQLSTFSFQLHSSTASSLRGTAFGKRRTVPHRNRNARGLARSGVQRRASGAPPHRGQTESIRPPPPPASRRLWTVRPPVRGPPPSHSAHRQAVGSIPRTSHRRRKAAPFAGRFPSVSLPRHNPAGQTKRLQGTSKN